MFIDLGDLNPILKYRAQFGVLQSALQILHRAWPAAASDHRISITSNEDDITNVLRRKMSEVKQTMSPPPEMRFEREPQSDAADDGTDLGLIDIMVCYTWNEQSYLVIECKRVWSKDNSLALKYVREGVNRFSSGKYSSGHAIGAMVGYVLCGNRDACVERIRNCLEKTPSSETGFDSEFGWKERDDVIPGSHVGSTQHLQVKLQNTIELIHSFVDFG